MRALLPASASTGTLGANPRSETSSRSISNSGVSPWSTRIRRLHPIRAIWRQSSEPIEPPAPVTSTVASAMYEATAARSTSTGSRPRTSSTCTGLICPARFRSPEISS